MSELNILEFVVEKFPTTFKILKKLLVFAPPLSPFWVAVPDMYYRNNVCYVRIELVNKSDKSIPITDIHLIQDKFTFVSEHDSVLYRIDYARTRTVERYTQQIPFVVSPKSAVRFDILLGKSDVVLSPVKTKVILRSGIITYTHTVNIKQNGEISRAPKL